MDSSNSDFKKKQILMIVGDYVEDYEVMVSFQALKMVGHEVHAVCPDKKKGEKVITAVHDFEEGEQTYSEKKGHLFELNYSFSSVDADKYDGLILTGGRAPEYLRLNKKVIEIVSHFIEKNKPIGAICHGIQILVATEKLTGRTATCYPAVQVEVKLAGAKYVEAKDEEAIVDGNLVTAVAWKAHPEWLGKFLNVLGTTFHSK